MIKLHQVGLDGRWAVQSGQRCPIGGFVRTVSLASVAFLVSILACAAQAGEYYVAQNHPAADDGNAGTVDKPFKTIGAALPKLKAGDTLLIRQGVYRECVYLGRGEGKWGALILPGMAAGEPGRPST